MSSEFLSIFWEEITGSVKRYFLIVSWLLKTFLAFSLFVAASIGLLEAYLSGHIPLWVPILVIWVMCWLVLTARKAKSTMRQRRKRRSYSKPYQTSRQQTESEAHKARKAAEERQRQQEQRYRSHTGGHRGEKQQQGRQTHKDAKNDILRASLKVLGLQLTPFPSEDEVKQAYKAAIRRVHPDIGGTEAEAKKVNHARDVVMTELERRNRRKAA